MEFSLEKIRGAAKLNFAVFTLVIITLITSWIQISSDTPEIKISTKEDISLPKIKLKNEMQTIEAEILNVVPSLDEVTAQLEKAISADESRAIEFKDMSNNHNLFVNYKDKLVEAGIKAKSSFDQVEKQILNFGLSSKFIQRHQEAVENFNSKHEELLTLVDNVILSKDVYEQAGNVEVLGDWLAANQKTEGTNHIDPENLPHKSINEQVRQPATSYASLNNRANRPILYASTSFNSALVNSSAGDLSATLDAPHSELIISKAAEFDNDPIAIYNWVYNNIKFVPSFGSIQGAEYTLLNRQGNAFDIASLLISLLRVSDVQSKYVYGTIDIPIAQAGNWVGGVNDSHSIAHLFSQGGVPNTLVYAGGAATHLRIEHVWVEAFVDFEPSRAMNNLEPDSWVPLDAAFKQYDLPEQKSIYDKVPADTDSVTSEFIASNNRDTEARWIQGGNRAVIDNFIDNYAVRLKEYYESNGDKYRKPDMTGRNEINQIVRKPLSAGLQYKVVAKSDRFSEIPDSFRHKFGYTLDAGNSVQRLDWATAELAGKKIMLNFVPETDEDLKAIKDFTSNRVEGERVSIPSYLIGMKAIFSIDDEKAFAISGLTMGHEVSTTILLGSPTLSQRSTSHRVIVGESRAIGLDLQGVSSTYLANLTEEMEQYQNAFPNGLNSEENQKHTSNIMHANILSYFYSIRVTSELAAHQNEVAYFPYVSAGVFQTRLSPSYWYGVPRSVELAGVTMDVGLYTKSSVHKNGDTSELINYRRKTGMVTSLLENSVPQTFFGGNQSHYPGVSAVAALEQAFEEGQKIYTLTRDNASQLNNIEIDQASRQQVANLIYFGHTVTLHERPIQVGNWVGNGYIALSDSGGSYAYIITGGYRGGYVDVDAFLAHMSAWGDAANNWMVDNIGGFTYWAIHHAKDSFADTYGSDSVPWFVWDFFAGNVFGGIESAANGEYDALFLEAALALLKPLKAVEKAAEKLCFVRGTLVTTRRGLIPIEEVKVGDYVLSREHSNGENVWSLVTETSVTDPQQTINVFVSDSQNPIGATHNHPFWVNGRGWVAASDLNIGDELITAFGDSLFVEDLEFVEEEVETYNFEVEGTHTYFVGEQGIWVHNDCFPKIKELAIKAQDVADAVEQKFFDTADQALAKFGELKDRILKKEFPVGTTRDPNDPNRILVPVSGDGHAVYEIDTDGKVELKDLVKDVSAGSPAHKANRWADYQRDNGNDSWSYERWSKTYDNNMVRASKANVIVNEYKNELANTRWRNAKSTDIKTEVPFGDRRVDIYNYRTREAIEVKSGYATATEFNLDQINKDIALRKSDGITPKWHFDGQVSKPLLDALDKAKIPWTIKDRSNIPSKYSGRGPSH